MYIKDTLSRKVFNVLNTLFISLVMLSCVLPFMHILALSLSDNAAATAGRVTLWPIGFNVEAYKYVASKREFLSATWISLCRVVLGTTLNMFLVIIASYPMSKETKVFRQRPFYVWFFIVTMFFGGGLIPSYMVIRALGLLNTIWALILPGAFSAWNMILLMNFFRGVPKEMEEAAYLDGAGHWKILWRIYIPVSTPVLATLLLFTVVGHWNSWFDGMFYMNSPSKYPLATYLSTLIMNNNMNVSNMSEEQLKRLMSFSDKTLRSAQIFVAMVPILLVYPFLQKYFMKGIVVGSVKG